MTKEPTTWLPVEVFNQIEAQYQLTSESPHGTGEHVALVSLLNQHGFSVSGWPDAAELAQRIVDDPYSDPSQR